MYFDPDGRFPNHDANPLKPENLPDLQARVKAEGADFGAAFDGDGDRCALVDENGEIVTCDLTSAVLAKYYLEREPGATIAYDLRSSKKSSKNSSKNSAARLSKRPSATVVLNKP